MSENPQQDLSQLEMAFAADPKAFVALTNAYLQLGRYMEAMVVCKKGIKALPDLAEGRLLLGRVYAEQGKVPKALEEVKALLQTNPEYVDAHFFAAELHEKSGRFDEAIEGYKDTLRRDRHHERAKSALKAKGIEFEPGPTAEELAAAQAAEEAVRRAEELRVLAAQQAAQDAADDAARRAAEAKARAMGAAMQMGGIAPSSTGPQPTISLPQMQAVNIDPAFAAAYAQNLYGYPGPQAQGGRRKLGAGFTFGLGALLLLVIVAVIVGLRVRKERQDQIMELLKDQQALVKKDTTRGHKKALELLERALKIDDSQPLAVSQYAYSLATLGDRGAKEVDDRLTAAVDRAFKVAKSHPLSVAAQMVQQRRAGNFAAAEALGTALGAPKELPLPVRIELGRAYALQGKTADMLGLADTMKDAPDPAALAFAGSAYRRVGDTFNARKALDNAIKTELDHDPSRALRALLILEQDDVVNLPIALDDVTSLIDLGKDALGAKQLGYATLGRALIAKRARTNDREVNRDIEAARLLLRNDPEMPLFEAKQAKDEKRWDDAIKLLNDAVKLDAFRIAPYLALIEVGARAKKFDVADKAYDDAIKAFGNGNLELALARGGRLLAEGKADDALAHLQAVQKTLDLAEVHRDIGKVFMKKGDAVNAVASLKKAAEKASVRGPGIQANVYTWLGRALAQASDHTQAKEAYAQALAATSEFPSTYHWLGLSLIELGDTTAAKEALLKYLKNDPNGAYAEEDRTRLETL
jgi:tetratricopeptide (TPR) repeat protein